MSGDPPEGSAEGAASRDDAGVEPRADAHREGGASDLAIASAATSHGARYERRAEIGRGGMGVVSLAFDRALGREVALKGAPVEAGADARARLLREASLAGRLDHPGIVPVHDVGRDDDGGVFFVMRVVRGRSLAERIAEVGGAAERTRLVRAVLAAAEAVGWAHALGVVHRDLKPANIMIGEFGETQVVDWGLARGPNDAADARAGAGTPRFMAPEQAAGRAADARSDVWSLGAILFEVATGAALRAGVVPAREAVRARVAAATSLELAAIVVKATAPEPDARYADAKALADDLARHLDGQRVAAHAYTSWELLVRFARAWRAALVVAALALAVGAVALGFGVAALDAERDRAVVAEAGARAALRDAEVALAHTLAAEAAARLREEAGPEAAELAARALALDDHTPLARGVAAATALEVRPSVTAERAAGVACDEVVLAPDGSGRCAAGAPPLRRVASASRVARWDAGYVQLDGGALRHGPCAPSRMGALALGVEAGAVAVCADGRVFVAASGDTFVARGALPAGEPLTTAAVVIARGAWAGQLVLGRSDGSVARAALAAHDGGVDAPQRWRVEVALAGGAGAIRDVDVAPDGTWALALAERGGARLWDPGAGAWLARLPERWSRHARFAADAPDALWSLGLGGRVRRWRLPPIAAAVHTRVMLDAGVTSLVADPRALVATTSASLYLLDAATHAPRWRAPWPSTGLKAATLVPELAPYAAAVVALTADAQPARVWRLEGDAVVELAPLGAPPLTQARRVASLVAGARAWLVTLPYAGGIGALDASGTADAALATLPWSFIDLATNAAHTRAAVLMDAPRAVCELVAGGAGVHLGACVEARAQAVAIDDVGRVLAAREGGVDVWELGLGAVVGALELPPDVLAPLVELAHGDGRVAAGDREGTTWLWDLASQRLVARIPDQLGRVAALAFGGERLFSGSWDATVRARAAPRAPATATEF